jgi:hypothetical protein
MQKAHVIRCVERKWERRVLMEMGRKSKKNYRMRD